MEKAFTLSLWQNKPSVRTPLGESRLNPLNNSINEIDNRVLDLYTKKLNAADANSLIADWQLDEETGVISVTRKDGSKYSFDLNIEKIPVALYMTPKAVLVLETDDGQQYTADLKGLIDTYIFRDSDTVAFDMVEKDGVKTVTAVLRAGSITGDLLNPDYLAEILQSVTTAEAYSLSALHSSAEAKRWAVGDPVNFPESVTDNSKYYAEQAAKSAVLAEQTAKINLPRVYVDMTTMQLMGKTTGYNLYLDDNGVLWGGVGNA